MEYKRRRDGDGVTGDGGEGCSHEWHRGRSVLLSRVYNFLPSCKRLCFSLVEQCQKTLPFSQNLLHGLSGTVTKWLHPSMHPMLQSELAL
jgi:hypothetical protein